MNGKPLDDDVSTPSENDVEPLLVDDEGDAGDEPPQLTNTTIAAQAHTRRREDMNTMSLSYRGFAAHAISGRSTIL